MNPIIAKATWWELWVYATYEYESMEQWREHDDLIVKDGWEYFRLEGPLKATYRRRD